MEHYILEILRLCGHIIRNIHAKKNIRPLIAELNDLVKSYEQEIQKGAQ